MTSSPIEAELVRINARLAEIHQGRKWIVAVDVVAAATGWVARLHEAEAEKVLVVAALPGVGPLPEGVEILYTDTCGDSMMEGFRAFFASLHDPSPELTAAVDRFDPVGDAYVIVPPFGPSINVLGRQVYGGRVPRVEALEDKTVVDALWDAAGVRRALSEIVEVDHAVAAHQRLAGPMGAVWAADNREGWHGGGEYTRWIRPGHDLTGAQRWFGDRAQTVRVMPFLNGIPCSIHGYVTKGHVAAFRPVEMVILRWPGHADFRYAGLATFWDPPDSDREDMRAAAVATGNQLVRTKQYRGGFSIDGVMTAEGFRPTELNSRLSAGLMMLARSVESLQLASMDRALRMGDVEFDAAWLAECIVPAADEMRSGGMGLVIPRAELAPRDMALVFDEAGVREAIAGENADASISGGNSASGVHVRMVLDPHRIPVGPSVAPLAVAAARFVEQEWGVPVGEVEAAPDLR